MTLDEFFAVTSDRIPTPREFIGFVRGRGWEFRVEGDKAALGRINRDDFPLAEATAAMLKREPYRTNVLRELRAEPVRESPPSERQSSAYALERLAGEGKAPAVESTPSPSPETCQSCRATVYLPGPEIAAACERMGCPYFRLRR